MKKVLILIIVLVGLVSANFWQITNEFKYDEFDLTNTNGWTLMNFSNNRVSKCGDKTIVGGPNVLASGSMRKEFNSHIDLNIIYISFDLYLIDSWQSGWEDGKD